MTDNLIPFESNQLAPTRSSERNRGPLPAPAWWTAAGARDRRAEERHTLAVRQEVRAGELAQIRAARQLAESIARLDAAARYNLEAKLTLEEADRRSKLIAADNPVLQQQFAVLDDTLFHLMRSEQIRRSAS